MTQAANEAQAAHAMTQEQRTIIQQANHIANLNAMLETALSQRNQLAAVVKSQAAALDAKTAELELAKVSATTPVAAAAKATTKSRAKKA